MSEPTDPLDKWKWNHDSKRQSWGLELTPTLIARHNAVIEEAIDETIVPAIKKMAEQNEELAYLRGFKRGAELRIEELKRVAFQAQEAAKEQLANVERLEADLSTEQDRHLYTYQRFAKLEADYQKIVTEVLKCDPIPAKDRPDDQLEPPWEVIARMRTRIKELEAEVKQ